MKSWHLEAVHVGIVSVGSIFSIPVEDLRVLPLVPVIYREITVSLLPLRLG